MNAQSNVYDVFSSSLNICGNYRVLFVTNVFLHLYKLLTITSIYVCTSVCTPNSLLLSAAHCSTACSHCVVFIHSPVTGTLTAAHTRLSPTMCDRHLRGSLHAQSISWDCNPKLAGHIEYTGIFSLNPVQGCV